MNYYNPNDPDVPSLTPSKDDALDDQLISGPPLAADFSGFEDINEGKALGLDEPARAIMHTTVMDLQLDGTTESSALYASPEDSGAYSNVYLDSIVYEDMGRPSKITVTVRPGDHLNK